MKVVMLATGSDTCMMGTTIGSGCKIEGLKLKIAGEDEAEVTGNVEHIVVEGWGGKTTPFARGIGREGLSAFPRMLPLPGKLFDVTAATEAAAADLAAWCSAALSLSRACRAGPRRRFRGGWRGC